MSRYYEEACMAERIRVHHLAVVVDDLDKALTFWRDALGLEVSQVRDEPEQASRVAFLPAGEAEIELVRPTTSDSGVARYLAKRGPGMHHICLSVPDLRSSLKRLASRGVRLINPEPMAGPDARLYAFVHPESTGGVLLELYEA
jgi:methylmalonyl-CoA/ethylmalonyl-CoA epimerase